MLTRHPGGPILTRDDIPEIPGVLRDPSSVFNPGAARIGDEIFLLLRVQTRGRETLFVPARSRDGVSFTVEAREVPIRGLEVIGEEVHHVYDPRITRIGGVTYVVFALDLDNGCRVGIARTDDFTALDFVGLVGDADMRNGVLFPEQLDDRYLMFSRPNRVAVTGGPLTGEEVVLLESKDLVTWEETDVVMEGRLRRFDERIGSGPPPLKTKEGWLHLYHGIATHFGSVSIYQAGVSLFDLDDPSRMIARGRNNVLEPREPWELSGQVPNVVFPSGWVPEETDDEGFVPDDSRILVYYGAADTCVGLAFGTVGELIDACEE